MAYRQYPFFEEEYVPSGAKSALTACGWLPSMGPHGQAFWTHPNHEGRFSWSEALTLQMASAIIAVTTR